MRFRGTDKQLKNSLKEMVRRGGVSGAIAEAAFERIETLERQFRMACKAADATKGSLHEHLEVN